jgi:hypothetical protein
MKNAQILLKLTAKEFPCEGDGYDYLVILSVCKVAAVDE